MGENPEFSASASGGRLQGLCESTHGVLFDRRYLVSSFHHSQRACYLSSPTTIHNLVVHHQIPCHTDSIMNRTLGFVHHHLRASPNKNGDSAPLRAVLDNQHAILGGSK